MAESDRATPGAPAPRRLAIRGPLELLGLRLELRTEPGRPLWYRIGAILAGVGVGAIIVVAGVEDPGDAFSQIWRATLGTAGGAENVLTTAAPLIFTGLAAGIPLRMRLWNIGGEGQLFVGAWAAAGVAFLLSSTAGGILIPLMLLAAAGAGSVYILAPALARAYLGVNEIITTLLLNFVAVFWMVYFVTGRWRDPQSAGSIKSERLPRQAELDLVAVGGVKVHWGLFLAIGLGLILWLYFHTSSAGYEVRMLGGSRRAGVFAGMKSERRMVHVMLLGGAMGGLAGATEMMGNFFRLSDSISNNTGFAGIAVAVLAGGSEGAVVVMGLVFAWLFAAGNALRTAGFSPDATFALVGFILLLAAIAGVLARYRLARIERREGRAAAATGGGATGGGEGQRDGT